MFACSSSRSFTSKVSNIATSSWKSLGSSSILHLSISLHRCARTRWNEALLLPRRSCCTCLPLSIKTHWLGAVSDEIGFWYAIEARPCMVEMIFRRFRFIMNRSALTKKVCAIFFVSRNCLHGQRACGFCIDIPFTFPLNSQLKFGIKLLKRYYCGCDSWSTLIRSAKSDHDILKEFKLICVTTMGLVYSSWFG